MKLTAREEMIHAYLGKSANLFWIIDENDNLVYANPSFCKFFGINKNIKSQNIFKIFPPLVASMLHEKHAMVRETKKPYRHIYKSLRADGSEFYLLTNVFPFGETIFGPMIGGEAWDITDQHKAEQKLQRANDRLVNLNKVTSDAIWEWNMRSGTVFRNQALEKLMGIPYGKSFDLNWWFDKVHPSDRKRVREKIKTCIENKQQTWRDEYKVKTSSKEYKTVVDQGYIIYEDEVPVKMIGSLQDVTDIKHLETQLIKEKLRQQKEIAEIIFQTQEKERTHIGHELHDNVNQILASANLFVDLINPVNNTEQGVKEKVKECIALAIQEIRSLSKQLVVPQLKENSLISSIKSLTADLKLSNKFNVEFDYVNEEFEKLSDNKKVVLFRILQEQLNNIIKHSQAKNIKIELSRVNGSVSLFVIDDGVGFDSKKHRSGIGLSNIHQRAKLYNGKAELISAPGKGCQLKVKIPVTN